MLKTLLYVNEDLASSIAIRFTDYLNKFVKLALYVIHVEEVDEKETAGTGWVRRTWEDGVTSNGKLLVDRMLRTENIDCHLAGRPKVFVGDREKEVIYELRSNNYDLFIQGFLNTSDPDSFYDFVSSSFCTESPCPVLAVKNLSISKKCAFLCADSVDPDILIEKSMAILGDSEFSFDIVFFKYHENEQLKIMDKKEGGSNLKRVETLLAQSGKTAENVSVFSGTPEQVGDYLKEYALVVSTLPVRKSMRMHVLSNSLASVMLVR